MRFALTCFVTALAGLTPALAFETSVREGLDRMKIGKVLPIGEVATLMRESERWCYNQEGEGCAWSDIYLDVTDTGATFEIGNAWDDEVNVYFTDQGTFEDNRFICESTVDWLPTLRATRRDDGMPIGGRELWAIRSQMSGNTGPTDCFDYVLKSSDEVAETITLLQRKWTDGVTDEAQDAIVTIHFDPTTAAALTWYF